MDTNDDNIACHGVTQQQRWYNDEPEWNLYIIFFNHKDELSLSNYIKYLHVFCAVALDVSPKVFFGLSASQALFNVRLKYTACYCNLIIGD